MPKKNPRRTDKEWLDLIQECRSSGLSDKCWCQEHHIHTSNFITRYEDFDKKPVRYRNQSILLSQENRKLYRFLLRNRQSAHPQCSSKRIPFQTLL
ncbi:MAG: IS66 family insertion sequence element accessory protein TnpA [Sellimonas intestinalis]|uniref:IS66 family insertion sequence element accessory protein TnpA n=1 Tax=Sellimonas intestinalis TaxID=1653434 RepID=UPI003992921C